MTDLPKVLTPDLRARLDPELVKRTDELQRRYEDRIAIQVQRIDQLLERVSRAQEVCMAVGTDTPGIKAHTEIGELADEVLAILCGEQDG